MFKTLYSHSYYNGEREKSKGLSGLPKDMEWDMKNKKSLLRISGINTKEMQ